MRFVKPLKGFRFWRTLGMLFFSTIVLTSQSSADKAYALETPIMPRTMTMAAAPKLTPAPVVRPENYDSTKTSVKKKVKAPSSENNNVVVAKADTSASVNVQKPVEAKVEIIKAPEEKKISNITAPLTPAEVVKNEHTNSKLTAADVKVPATDIKAEKIDVVPAQKLQVKAPIKPIENAEIKPVVEKETVKPSTNNSVNNVLKSTEKKPIVKNNEVALTKAVKPMTIQQAKSAAKKSVKKNAVEENVIPQEWDWFSTPLVWVEDANGKMVLVADKSAPKISLNEKKVDVAPVKDESKAVLIANELPLITSVKPAEPDFVQVVPMVAEDVIYSSENEKVSSPEKARLEEAPVASFEMGDFEEAPVAYEVNVEMFKEASDDQAEKEEEKAEAVIEVPETNTSSVSGVKNEYKPFAKALERMERIRRLRKAEAEERGTTLAKANRSVQAIRMSNYINELINKSDDSNNNASEKSVIQIRSNTSSDDEYADAKQAENNAEMAYIEAKTANNENSVSESENAEKTTFKPYIGVFGSNTVRRARYNNWKYAWTR